MAPKAITLQLTAAHARFLEDRSAESSRSNTIFSRTAVLGRMLDRLGLYQELTDPRQTSGMPEEVHALIISQLPEPWTLRRFEILHLDAILADAPGFAPALAAAGLDRAAVLAAVAAASPAEKLTLVHHAVRHQAPALGRRVQ